MGRVVGPASVGPLLSSSAASVPMATFLALLLLLSCVSASSTAQGPDPHSAPEVSGVDDETAGAVPAAVAEELAPGRLGFREVPCPGFEGEAAFECGFGGGIAVFREGRVTLTLVGGSQPTSALPMPRDPQDAGFEGPMPGLMDATSGPRCQLTYAFEGCRDVQPMGVGELGFRVNSFLGKDPDGWVSGLRSFSRVVYRGLYPGIDLVYNLDGGCLKYEFVLRPGSDPGDILVRVSGGEGVALDDDDLVISTPLGEVRDSGLVAHYEGARGEVVDCSFAIIGDGAFSFELGDRDLSRAVVIDPLVFSTFIGPNSDGWIQAYGLTTDGELRPVVVGYILVMNVTEFGGGVNLSRNDTYSMFVARLDPLNGSLMQMALIGGEGSDGATCARVDARGDILVLGDTTSTLFPRTANASQPEIAGEWDCVVLKLSGDMSRLLYASYLGGEGEDYSDAMDIGPDGGVFGMGTTFSEHLPTTEGAFQEEYGSSEGSGSDCFLFRLSPDSLEPTYVSYLGGSYYDHGTDIAVDDSGHMFACVKTISSDFPVTEGSLSDYKLPSRYEQAVTRFEPNLTALNYSTFLGYAGASNARCMALDSRGRAVVVTRTHEWLPTTKNALSRSLRGGNDCFFTVLSEDGSKAVYASYFGGDAYEESYCVATDQQGDIYITGSTSSDNLTTTEDALLENLSGGDDAFLLRLNGTDYSLEHFTYIGQTSSEWGEELAVPRPGLVFLFGYTASSNFTVTNGSWRTVHNGWWWDMFLMKLNFDKTPPVAEAGADIVTRSGRFVTLDGTMSWDNIAVLRWQWSFEYGEKVRTLFGPEPRFQFIREGLYTVLLNVSDEMGMTSQDTMRVLVLEAGDDVELDVGEAFTFQCPGSAECADTLDWSWSLFYDGANVSYHTSVAQHLFDLPGAFLVNMTVTDSLGHEVRDCKVVRVRSRTGSLADAGDDFNIDQHENVTLDATGSTEGLNNYTWYFNYEKRQRRLFGPRVNFTFHVPGNYSVTLSVTDLAGMRHHDLVDVNVRDITPPEAVCDGDVVVDQGETVHFNGHNSTDNVRVVEYEWTFVYNEVTFLLSGPQQSFTFNTPGAYTVFLFVRDAEGNRDEANLTVTVLDTTPPIAHAGLDVTTSQHDKVIFDGSGSIDNVKVVNWTWTFVYDGRTQELYGTFPDFLFDIVGTYTVALDVEDAAGHWNRDLMDVTVLDMTKPVASAGLDLEVVAGETAFLNGSGSWDDNRIVSYVWEFEHDGQDVRLEGRRPVFHFEVPGEYLVDLTVSDAAGNTAHDDVLVTVTPAPEPEETPWVAIGASVLVAVLVLALLALVVIPRLRGVRAGEK